ncbi:MAG: hypothetical protein KCHDKBKB_01033 [Elusimicrobia bacterium]|nr:hypothetical protein [Elusimicrobiota bacterium]
MLSVLSEAAHPIARVEASPSPRDGLRDAGMVAMTIILWEPSTLRLITNRNPILATHSLEQNHMLPRILKKKGTDISHALSFTRRYPSHKPPPAHEIRMILIGCRRISIPQEKLTLCERNDRNASLLGDPSAAFGNIAATLKRNLPRLPRFTEHLWVVSSAVNAIRR